MNDADFTKKFIGSAIKSSVYGEGIVQDFFFKNNSYFISASFFIDGSETNKSFLASTAFSSGSLRFEDENHTKAIKLILDKTELPQKQSLSGNAQKTVICKGNRIRGHTDGVLREAHHLFCKPFSAE